MDSAPRQFGPRPRDELAAWSTAPLASDELGPIPAYPAEPPPGSVVTIAGHDVLVRRTAGPADGPAVWFIHGLEGSSTNFDRLAAALRPFATGWALDLPGSGLSGPPPRRGPWRGYSIRGEAELCARAIRRLSPGPVHLVGNSRGGVVATFLAAAFPDLVRTLTLVSPAVPDLRLLGERGADARLAALMLPGAARWAVRQLGAVTPAQHAESLAATCFGEPDALSRADLAAAERAFAERDAFPWAAESAVESLRSLIGCQLRPGRWSFASAARSVAVPVLIVWGTRDRLVDVRLARRTAAAFRTDRLLVLEKTGHVAQMERPAPVARAMVALWRDAAQSAGVSVAGRDVTVAGAP